MQATGGDYGETYCKYLYYDSDNGRVYDEGGYAGAGGSPNGNSGSGASGGAGFALSFTKSSGSYGAGGAKQYAGGSGGYNTGYVTVTPGTTYTITVGAGGSPNSNNTKYGNYGTAGYVYIAYGGDI